MPLTSCENVRYERGMDAHIGHVGTQPSDLVVAGQLATTSGVARGEVHVRRGRISAVVVGDAVTTSPAQRIDVGDAYVLPGVIDAHVHCLSHPGEGIEAATRSAAAGGVTTILEMPFDAAGPVWTVQRLREKRELIAREAHVDVGLYATVHPDGEGDSVAELAAAGATCFKLSTFDTDPDRFPRTMPDRFLDVLAQVAAVDRPVCVHAEDDGIIRPRLERYRRERGTAAALHARSRPPVSETTAVAEVLELARATGARVHLCHLSLPRSVDLVYAHASSGTRASLETCPHYLLLTEDDLTRHGGRAKVNPPLRSGDAVDGLWARLADGRIDMLVSDHAPWPLEYKTHDDIFANHSGAPGVETLLPLVAGAALFDRDVAMSAIVRVTSERPADLFGLAHRKGRLLPGLDADLTVFDPTVHWTVDESRLHSNAGWSPYAGREVRGAVTLTVSRGEVIWDGRRVRSQPGRGCFLEPVDPPRDAAADVGEVAP